jgi:hypothetical protein
MGKFRKKPVIISANVFSWGMEAGIMRYNEYIPKDGDDYPEQMRSKQFPGYLIKYEDELKDRGFADGQWKPYIETIHHGQRVTVEEGDYIIPEPDGIHFYPCKPDIFDQTYEEVCPNCDNENIHKYEDGSRSCEDCGNNWF